VPGTITRDFSKATWLNEQMATDGRPILSAIRVGEEDGEIIVNGQSLIKRLQESSIV